MQVPETAGNGACSWIGRDTIRLGMRYSILDGSFASPYISLTTGVILTGFLLALGATEFQIGLAAMCPLLAGLLQPVGAELVRRRGGWRRPIIIGAILTDSLLWGATFLIVLLVDPTIGVLLIIGILALQHSANAFVGAPWTSWMSDLIPAQMRGRYFGRRNFICNSVGVATAVVAGQLIEFGNSELWTFLTLILIGLISRFISLVFLSRQPEPYPTTSTDDRFTSQLARPLTEPNFRTFVYYSMAWGFAVNLTAPFFAVYMLKTLEIDFGLVALLSGGATVVNIVGQRFWGPLCDRFGNHPILMVTSVSIALHPIWWLFTGNIGVGFFLLLFLNLSGAFAWAGHGMANSNLMMRIAPTVGKTSFFAVQAALAGAAGAAGPVIGGLLAQFLTHHAGGMLIYLPDGLKTLFLISGVLRLVICVVLLRHVREPQSRRALNAGDFVHVTIGRLRLHRQVKPFLQLLAPLRAHYAGHRDRWRISARASVDRRGNDRSQKKQ